jgi:hypothetical protein
MAILAATLLLHLSIASKLYQAGDIIFGKLAWFWRMGLRYRERQVEHRSA